MELGVGYRNVLWNYYKYRFGNPDFVETARTQRGFSYSDWNEFDLHDFDGIGHESSRLWNDGRTSHYSYGFACDFGCGIFCGMAIQFLEIEEAWKMLSLK